jgi:hypothetical protein
MNSNFDLNIHNYRKEELEDIFELPVNYDSLTLEMRENKLRENIHSDPAINESVRIKTIAFLKEAKEILLSELKTTIFNKFSAANVYNLDTSLKTSKVVEENGANFIIQKPNTPFSQSFPSEFYPGTINPLKKRSLRQYLNIDTRFRDNYYSTSSTNFHLDLPIKFSDITTMQLTAFEIPNSYYYVSDKLGNNFFTITIEDTGVSQVFFIPNGNYTSTGIVNYLNHYVSSGVNGGPLGGAAGFKDLVFSENVDSGIGTGGTGSGSSQMVIGIKSTATLFNFTLNFQANSYGEEDTSTPLPLKFGWLIGFRNGIYTSNSSYVSEAVIDLKGFKYMFLVVDDYNNNVNNSFYSAFNSSVLNKNILARISLQNTSFFDTAAQNNLSLVTTARQYFGPVDIQKLGIQLLDEYGRVIDLNNMDFSFCLTLQSIYDL